MSAGAENPSRPSARSTGPRADQAHPAPAPTLKLTARLADVPDIGETRARALAELGLRNVGQLIAHVPMRYERLEAERPIAECTHDSLVATRGEIVTVGPLSRGRGRAGSRFKAVLMDGDARMDLLWFNMPYVRDRLHPGVRVRVQGKATRNGPTLQMVNPLLQVIRPGAPEPIELDERVRPVYPAGAPAASWQIEQAVGKVLDAALPSIEDHLPESFRSTRNLPSLAEAYRMVHRPAHLDEALAGRRRLAYDELLLLQVALGTARAHRLASFLSPALRWNQQIDRHIRQRLPFALTAAQERVVAEIAADLQRDTPTSRLVQGDVGSGKTVVALYAMLMAVASRWQGALMAPTELLAEQHHRSITAMLAGSDVRVELLTGSMDPRHRAGVLKRIAAGDADIVVGTHALLTDRVRFHGLAVAVIDEQHKFGVHQRAELRSRAEDADTPHPLTPHVLVMTATPIPRTLALSLLGDLDVSTIDELPPGRRPITTRIVDPDREDEVMRYVRQRLSKGEQAYIVVPAIEPGSPLLDPIDGPRPNRPAGLVEVKARLEKGPLAGLRLAAVHGRLDRDARERVMQRFRAGEIDALIATTVIEVGVDVPNATVMVVLDAERFGLAQLHQLRGRVGRGSKASACILIGRATTPDGQARLDALATHSDGFKLAEKDLEIRGFGDVAGIRQSGAPPFKVADLSKDIDLLLLARRDAASLVVGSAGLDDGNAAILRRRVIKSHGKWLGLADTA